MDEKHWCKAKYHSSRCSGGFWCHVKFRKFIIISPACKSRAPMSFFSCHFEGHPQFWTWGIPKSFTSASSVDMSIKRAIVAHLNKQRPDNVIITSLWVFFPCCSGALTCESPQFLWTYLTSDLSSMCRRQQIAAAATEGSQLVLTHRPQFTLTGTCLLGGNNEWVRISDCYKWLWLVLNVNDLLRHILHPFLHT